MSQIKRYCQEIVRMFKPQKIILFGSHAYGSPHTDSDVDVMVVMRDAKKLGRRPAVTIRLAVKAGFPVDMLVREEREVAQRVSQGDSFMLDVTEHGRVMYEAVHT